MDQRFQTSLIPKRPSGEGSSIAKAKKPGTLFYWISVLIFFAAVVAAATFFVYERYLLSQIAQKKLQIQEEVKAFDPNLSQTLTKVKDRIDSGEQIIENHLALSLFFELLEDLTARGVYFTNFDFKTPSGAKANFVAEGEAPSYAVLAFQSDALKASKYFLKPEFSEINLNDEGRVVFTLTAEMDPKVILYKTALSPSVSTSTNSNGTTTSQ